jgi:hypothetical protein
VGRLVNKEMGARADPKAFLLRLCRLFNLAGTAFTVETLAAAFFSAFAFFPRGKLFPHLHRDSVHAEAVLLRCFSQDAVAVLPRHIDGRQLKLQLLPMMTEDFDEGVEPEDLPRVRPLLRSSRISSRYGARGLVPVLCSPIGASPKQIDIHYPPVFVTRRVVSCFDVFLVF